MLSFPTSSRSSLGSAPGRPRRKSASADRAQTILPQFDPDGHTGGGAVDAVRRAYGYVLTKWRFPATTSFHPHAARLPSSPSRSSSSDGEILGVIGLAGTRTASFLSHDLWYRFHDAVFSATTTKPFQPSSVRAAMIDGASFFQIFRRILLPIRADHRRHCDSGNSPISGATFSSAVSFADIYSMPVRSR